MSVMWKIYYGDDTTFSNEDGSPAEAPAWDVQCIVQSNEKVGRTIPAHKDFYIYRDGVGWVAVDWFGLVDFLVQTGLVKFGRTIPSLDFERIYRMANNDPDFPKRSGYLRDEYRAKSNN